jgi:hypothetical protein
MYKILAMIKQKYGCKFIIVGDKNQLGPVDDNPIDYEQSDILKNICDYNQRLLDVNMRSDNVMWDIYHEILENKDVKHKFKNTDKHKTKLNICLTNITRHAINKIWMDTESKKAKKILKLDKLNDHNEAAYEMILFPNMPVVSKKNWVKMDICNNERFTLINFNARKKKITIKNDKDELIEISFLNFQKMFEIAYCITAHCAQGATIEEPYTIYEWNHFNAKKNWRLVAVSRTTNKNNIYISTMKPETSISGKIYKITNSINNKVYIGSTITSIEKRFEGHLVDCDNQKGKLYKAMVKHGKQNFKIELLTSVKVADHSELFELETAIIKKYDSIVSGYNSIVAYRNKHN